MRRRRVRVGGPREDRNRYFGALAVPTIPELALSTLAAIEGTHSDTSIQMVIDKVSSKRRKHHVASHVLFGILIMLQICFIKCCALP